MIIEKAGFLNGTEPHADSQVLEEFFGPTSPNSVTVDGKTVESRFNPVDVPSRFNPACPDKGKHAERMQRDERARNKRKELKALRDK